MVYHSVESNIKPWALLRKEISEQCKEILKDYPGNRGCKYAKQYLETEEGKSLSDEGKVGIVSFLPPFVVCHQKSILIKPICNQDGSTFHKCIKSGLDNPDSGLGCYAMTPEDYCRFRGFFDNVIRDYHGDESGEKRHVTDWNIEDKSFDVKRLGLDKLSMRVRVGRNLIGFNLPGNMNRAERIEFELRMLPVFDQLIEKYGGRVYSLTPDFGDKGVNPNLITNEEYHELVDAHVMFKDMSADPFLNSAGISNDWPYGRGCWQSEDKMRVIWFGEEDHLRIMCMKVGSDLLDVFTNLQDMLDSVSISLEGSDFARDDHYGYITSCPSNLGTGMRASVHVKVPNLTSDGTDQKAKELCKPLGLSVRGIGGEHTPIGKDGTVDISPSARLFIKEREIIEKLFEGVQQLMAIECA
jgi:creatine kinase